MTYASDSPTGSTDEYETDNCHPPSDNDDDVKFLKGGRLSRSPERAPPARVRGVVRSSPRRTSPRWRADNSGNTRSNGVAASSGSSVRKASGSSSNSRPASSSASKPTAKKSTSSDDSYAGDNSDYESDNEVKSKKTSQSSDQKYPIGTAVSKQFEGEWYSGNVTKFHPADESDDEDLYSVLYDDGDTEDYNEEELEKLVNNAKKGKGNNNKADDKAKSVPSKSLASDSDSDDDPFSHLGKSNKNKRRFQYSDSDSEDSASSSDKRNYSKKKGATGLSDSDNSDNEIFNNNAKRRAVPKKKAIALDSSDSDSDVEIQVKSPPKKSSPKRLSLRSASPKKKSQSAANAASLHNPSLRAQSENTLGKSRAVLEKLKNSKQYHAEELEEKLPTPSRQSMDSVYNVDDSSVEALELANSKPAAKPNAVEYTGDLLKLTLRYKDGTNKNKEVVLRIKSDEPLKFLNERFQGGIIKSLHFDGINLDLNKTPQFYDMDDDDLVDAVVAGSSSGGPPRAAASDILKLLVRRSGTTSSHEFGMPKTAPLSKLIAEVCKMFKVPFIDLEYNGRKLDPSKSCQAEGISSNVTLDAIACQSISLEFRVNGDSKDVHKIHAMSTGTFKHAMEAFAAKKNCSLADCKFEFDGEVLQPMTRVESLDLEGGEIIDVKVNVAAAAANPPPLQDDDGDVVMADSAAVMISVRTVRNLAKTKPKSWKVSNADPISVLNREYVNYYKSKGCKQVQFYVNNTIVSVETKSFRDLGIVDGATIYAMENGKAYK